MLNWILGTPDFGHSDLWHQSFAFRNLFGQSLQTWQIPFWSKDIGTGYPLFAEGEAGLLNWLNLALFKVFNPVTAFNLIYILAYLFALVGAYLFGRTLKLSRLSSFLLGFLFAFSGVMVTQVRATQFVQTASFFPWLLFSSQKLIETGQKRWIIIFALLFSQQIYSGYPQIVFISLFATGLLCLWKLIKEKMLARAILFVPALGLGLIFAAPQILASLELIMLSSRTEGIPVSEMARFPFVPKHLLTFFWPYLLGDPRIGTYPPFSTDWGIFWESTGYIGIIPLLLVIKDIKNCRKSLVFWVILFISLILMLGKSTPLFFIFQIPPFSFFRVPARFIFLVSTFAAILAAASLDKIKNHNLKLILVIISCLDLGFFAATYNAKIDSSWWLRPSETVTLLKADPSWYRIYSSWPVEQWNAIFKNEGWKNMEKYYPFRNALDPNQNLLWQIPSVDYYTGMAPRRMEYFNNLIKNGINDTEISSSSAKLLSISGVKYVILPKPVKSGLISYATISGSPSFFVFQNKNSLPHAYLTSNFIIAKDISDLISKLTDPNQDAVVLEEDPNITYSTDFTGKAEVINDNNLKVLIKTDANQKTLLILSDSFYPKWIARVDGNVTKILPVNLNQRAIVVPSGEHEVKFSFQLL